MTDTAEDLVPIIPWPAPPGTVCPTLHLAMGSTQGSLLAVETMVLEVLDAEPSDVRTHDLALMIDHLDLLRTKLREIEDAVQEAFCQALPYKTTSVGYPDCAALIPRWGGSRIQWDSKTLRDDVRSKVLREFNTDPAAEGAFDLVEKVVSITGSNVKTTGLKKLGLDPDDYSEKVPKAPSVQVVR